MLLVNSLVSIGWKKKEDLLLNLLYSMNNYLLKSEKRFSHQKYRHPSVFIQNLQANEIQKCHTCNTFKTFLVASSST